MCIIAAKDKPNAGSRRPTPPRLRVLTAAAVLSLAAALWAAAALAHPNDKPGGPHHAHDGDAIDATAAASSGPSAAEKKRRVAQLLKRTEQRLARLEEIRKDRRGALRRRLSNKLEGEPLNTSMKDELRVHARRMARLQRIRYLAASHDDYDTVQSVDMLIGKENSRHEIWWRTIRRIAVRQASAAKAKARSSASAVTSAKPSVKGKQP